jgi:flavin-binding protein dodecin
MGSERSTSSVTVEKYIELAATAPTLDEAVREAVDRARQTLDGITGFTVERISGAIENDTISYRASVRVAFVLLERFHQ